MDAGGLAQMKYSENRANQSTATNALGLPGSGFGGTRTRISSKRLSVALPPKVTPIEEHQVDNPTPRTSRSHLLAGLRTQPKTPAHPVSAPYDQTQHPVQGTNAPNWIDAGQRGYEQGLPQSALGNSYDIPSQHALNAARQMYSLPEQVLAPPSFGDHADEMDPAVLQQMQMTSLYLAQRQQQLQQQLANITAAASGMNLGAGIHSSLYQQNMLPQTLYAQQQQIHPPLAVPGQPGVYLVYNPAVQGYSYVCDQQVQQQARSPNQQPRLNGYFTPAPTPGVAVSPPVTGRSSPANVRSFTPPKKTQTPPYSNEPVEPLPPPSANAFRRGHKKSPSSLSISNNVIEGPKTASTATFGSQRTVFPPTPMTGTFQPGGARAGDHPMRQPRGPPPLDELTAAPTSKHEGSKNFATRQRRRAVDNLLRAGIGRLGGSRSSDGSPVSDGAFAADDDVESLRSSSSRGSQRLSPIGSEMKEKRASGGSADGYFCGLSSASSSEAEEVGIGAFKQPPTPAAIPVAGSGIGGGERKKMVLGMMHATNAAEKRRIGVPGVSF